jgi:hypothetical protein
MQKNSVKCSKTPLLLHINHFGRDDYYITAKVLVLVGLGLFLKQLVALIKESRLKNINQ